MDAAKLQAWWAHRQGLDGSLMGKTAREILLRSGWARSVGGVGPYLTLHSRGGVTREEADAAVAALEIHELPSARGCTYLLPADDFALGLKVGQGFGTVADMRSARKLGVTDAEIEKLQEKVLSVLGKGPLDTDQIREGVGAAVRSLGEEGKKKGLTTTLPLALGFLQSSGDIRRVPINGRLDQQRYRYTLWKPNPLSKYKLSTEGAYTELARRFFRWIGPATVAEFQWFSALGAKAARAAMEPLGLVPLAAGDARLMHADDHAALNAFKAPKTPHYVLTSGLDAISQHRRDVRGLLSADDFGQQVFTEKTRQTAGSLTDLPSHAILDRGRIVGLWEFDPEAGEIVWMAFGKADKALKEAVARTEGYVREQLGDARSFSLDSPKSRLEKLAGMRQRGAGN